VRRLVTDQIWTFEFIVAVAGTSVVFALVVAVAAAAVAGDVDGGAGGRILTWKMPSIEGLVVRLMR